MTDEKLCIACGMPMSKKEQHPLGDESKNYCIHCARPDGSMQSFDERRENSIAFVMRTQGFAREAAAEITNTAMKKLPAWRHCYKEA